MKAKLLILKQILKKLKSKRQKIWFKLTDNRYSCFFFIDSFWGADHTNIASTMFCKNSGNNKDPLSILIFNFWWEITILFSPRIIDTSLTSCWASKTDFFTDGDNRWVDNDANVWWIVTCSNKKIILKLLLINNIKGLSEYSCLR